MPAGSHGGGAAAGAWSCLTLSCRPAAGPLTGGCCLLLLLLLGSLALLRGGELTKTSLLLHAHPIRQAAGYSTTSRSPQHPQSSQAASSAFALSSFSCRCCCRTCRSCCSASLSLHTQTQRAAIRCQREQRPLGGLASRRTALDLRAADLAGGLLQTPQHYLQPPVPPPEAHVESAANQAPRNCCRRCRPRPGRQQLWSGHGREDGVGPAGSCAALGCLVGCQ